MRITNKLISSDLTEHQACWSPDAAADGQGAWIVTWLPSRLLTRNQAITAMTLAEAVNGDEEHAHRFAPFVADWAAELELSGPDALVHLGAATFPEDQPRRDRKGRR